MPSNHVILCCPRLPLPSIFPRIRVFSSESALHIRWPKYWSFSFSISPSSVYSGLLSFSIDWFDLAAQGALNSLLQHHNSKASVLWRSAFFTIQLSHPYMTTGKKHSFDYTDLCWQSDGMILVFWMLSFKPVFSLSSFTLLKRLFSSSLLSAIRRVSSAYLRLMFLPTLLTYFICWSLSWEQGPSSGKRIPEKGASPAVCTQKASF